jgi:hypothetical protein
MTITGPGPTATELTPYEFAEFCFGALQAVAPEREQDLRQSMELESVRLDIQPDTFGLLFQVGLDDGGIHKVIETSPLACYLLWAVAMEALANMAAVFAASRFQMPDGRFLNAAETKRASETAATALAWVEDAITSGQVTGSPSRLPRRAPYPLPPGADQDIELAATELALCAAGWVMHHELAHARLGHIGSSIASLMKEKEADQAATEWLINSITGSAAKKRSVGIAVATITLLRLEEAVGRGTRAGRFTHPPAIERLHTALSDVRIDDDGVAVACIALCRLLDARNITPPSTIKSGGPVRELLDELALLYQQSTK